MSEWNIHDTRHGGKKKVNKTSWQKNLMARNKTILLIFTLEK
jgi:hypothetical protein